MFSTTSVDIYTGGSTGCRGIRYVCMCVRSHHTSAGRGGGGILRHLVTAQRSAGSASKTEMGWDQRSPTRSPTQPIDRVPNGSIACLVHFGLTGGAPTQNVEVYQRVAFEFVRAESRSLFAMCICGSAARTMREPTATKTCFPEVLLHAAVPTVGARAMIATRLSPFCSVRKHRVVPLTLLAVLDTPESFPATVCSRSSSAKSGVSNTSSSAPLAPLAMVSTMVCGNRKRGPSRGARL